METIYTFARVERKYFIDELTRKRLLQRTRGMLLPDAYGKSTVCSLYLDTPDHLIIRNSLDARSYKEKLRLRSYGTPRADTPVFLELKKKVQGVVYKRRVSLPLREAEAYLDRKRPPLTGQIWREIDYAMQFYFWPGPAMVIACEREAYTWAEDPTFRVTFDDSIRARSNAQGPGRGQGGEVRVRREGQRRSCFDHRHHQGDDHHRQEGLRSQHHALHHQGGLTPQSSI